MRRLQVVRAGEDVEEAGREVGRLRRGVECAMVGDHVGTQGKDLAVAGRRDLAVHMVVAGEGGGHQVFRAVLDPLHRPAGHDRADDRAHVPRVDAHLAAEAAADVRRDHADLVLGQARHERVDRAVRVRGLGGAPDGELPGDLVEVRDRPVGLQRRRVDPRIQHLLRYDYLGLREDLVSLGSITGLPVEDVVVGLAFLVVADHRRLWFEGAAGVDDRRQRLVLDFDQLERVPRRVAVFGDHEGHLLALEPDLVGGQHRLGVVRQRGHPGQVETGQRLAGDDRLHLRVCLGCTGVDGHDPGMGVRAVQDRAVQHAGQAHIVDVGAPAADEARVLLAGHPAEAHRGGLFHRSHADTSAAGCSAAQRTARTMFS